MADVPLDTVQSILAGPYAEQAVRLLRSAWPPENGTRMLAEELFAILQSPMGPIRGPVTIVNQSGGPALTVINQSRDPAVAPIVTQTLNPDDPDYTLPTEPLDPGGPTPQDTPGGAPEEQEGGGGTAGTITSNSGTTALVALVTGETVTAAIGQLADGENAAGIKVILTKTGKDGPYFCQLAVWQ